MGYRITKEIKSETKVNRWIYVTDFFFLLGYGVMTMFLSGAVHEKLKVLFCIFSAVMAIFLTIPSLFNRKRRLWQSMLLFLRKDRQVYCPVPNISKSQKGREALHEKA